MITDEPNYAKIKLDRYLARSENIKLSEKSFFDYGNQLLKLLFALQRKENGLHLRWNPYESEQLALLTLNEVNKAIKTKKHLNPAIHAVAKGIRIAAKNKDEVMEKLLLGAAEDIINGKSNEQRRIAQRPRKRKEHPFKEIVRRATRQYHSHNHNTIRDKAIIEGKNTKLIYQVEDEQKKIVFNDNHKDITFTTIRDWISELRPK
jgi:hypothetical protein